MADVARTRGRKMTRLLEQALDAVPSEQIPPTVAALEEQDSRYLGEIFRALAIELHLVALRRQQDRDTCDAISLATTESLLGGSDDAA